MINVLYCLIVIIVLYIIFTIFTTQKVIEGLVSNDDRITKIEATLLDSKRDDMKSLEIKRYKSNYENILMDKEDILNSQILNLLLKTDLTDSDKKDLQYSIQLSDYLPKLMDFIEEKSK